MLNRGALAGLKSGRFRSGFQHRWRLICSVKKLRDAYTRAYRDILGYAASSPKKINRLINLRMKLLGRETGYGEEMAQLELSRKDQLDGKLDEMLQQHYNLTQAEAAQILDSALSSEAINHGLKRARQ